MKNKIKKFLFLIFLVYFILKFILLLSGYFYLPDINININLNQKIIELNKLSHKYWFYGYELKFFILLNNIIYTFICIKVFLDQYYCKNINGLFKHIILILKFSLKYFIGLFLANFPYIFILSYIKQRKFNLLNIDINQWLYLVIKNILFELLVVILIVITFVIILAYFKKKWYIAITFVTLVFGIIFLYSFQLLIIPLFYEVKSIKNYNLDTNLFNAIYYLTDINKINIEDIYILNESYYSKKINAIFTGIFLFKKIYIFDNLFLNHKFEEIIVILSHEIGHYVLDHEFKSILLITSSIFLIALLIDYILVKTKVSIELINENISKIIICVIILYQPFFFFTMPVQNYISRIMEREADNYSLYLTFKWYNKNLNDLNQAIKKTITLYENLILEIANKNLSLFKRDKLNYFFYATHPDLMERLENAYNFKVTYNN